VINAARAKLHRWIPLPGWFQARQFAEHFQTHFVQAHFGVEVQWRLQILRLQRAARQFIQPLPQRVNLSRLEARPAAIA
jgi:hypothetical protein